MNKKARLLTELLDRVPHLKQQKHSTNDYQIWRDEVYITLEKLFGKNSREYNRFLFSMLTYTIQASEAEKQQEYLRDLNADERKLQSIIAMQGKEEELNKVLRLQRLLRFIKDRLIIKICHELKDFIATIIAKIVAEKSK